jgi:hypothetical protein
MDTPFADMRNIGFERDDSAYLPPLEALVQDPVVVRPSLDVVDEMEYMPQERRPSAESPVNLPHYPIRITAHQPFDGFGARTYISSPSAGDLFCEGMFGQRSPSPDISLGRYLTGRRSRSRSPVRRSAGLSPSPSLRLRQLSRSPSISSFFRLERSPSLSNLLRRSPSLGVGHLFSRSPSLGRLFDVAEPQSVLVNPMPLFSIDSPKLVQLGVDQQPLPLLGYQQQMQVQVAAPLVGYQQQWQAIPALMPGFEQQQMPMAQPLVAFEQQVQPMVSSQQPQRAPPGSLLALLEDLDDDFPVHTEAQVGVYYKRSPMKATRSTRLTLLHVLPCRWHPRATCATS